MNQIADFFKSLLRPSNSRPPTPEEQEAILAEKALKMEKLAAHCETEAELRKRIDAAKKRIAATRSKGGSSSGIVSLIQHNKLLVGLVVIIGLSLLIAKSCS